MFVAQPQQTTSRFDQHIVGGFNPMDRVVFEDKYWANIQVELQGGWKLFQTGQFFIMSGGWWTAHMNVGPALGWITYCPATAAQDRCRWKSCPSFAIGCK